MAQTNMKIFDKLYFEKRNRPEFSWEKFASKNSGKPPGAQDGIHFS